MPRKEEQKLRRTPKAGHHTAANAQRKAAEAEQSELGTEQVAGRAYVMGRSNKMFPSTARYKSPYLKELMGETGLAKFLLTPLGK